LLFLLTAGCSLAPKFETPKTDFPSAFKEDIKKESVPKDAAWKPVDALPAQDRGAWWKVFHDKHLDVLEERVAAANQTLKAAAARVVESRAAARAGSADVFPNISVGANGARTKSSSANPVFGGGPPYTVYDAQAVASWEPDFFNRLRDQEHALLFGAQAEEAGYSNAMLSLQADVAQNYFSLRAADAERAVLRRAIKIRVEGVRIMTLRKKEGEVRGDDLSRVQSELEGTRAELTALDRRRAIMEHAMAVLLGQISSGYIFAEAPLEGAPPRIPGGLPSQLLERRPDIAAAHDLMAAANARIGAARAAFFPVLNLTASGGFESAALGNLFQWSARTWALGQTAGMALALPIFDNGRRSASLDAARAAYDGTLAQYRQQVLVAFRDVEDNLSEQRLLLTQSQQQNAAAAAADNTMVLTQKRFNAGDADYFEVVDSNRMSLAADRAAVQVKGQRYIAAVALIRALGGGW
jgi:multidrug efflux system outer membrane protein